MTIAGSRALLLSVRPRFAAAMIDGSKSVELRRQRVDVAPGTQVVLYSSAPVMAVTATGQIQEVDVDTPERLWKRHERHLGLTPGEFEEYLVGVSRASALLLRDIVALAEPISLTSLRTAGRFHPPQSYRFLAEGDPEHVRRLVGLVGEPQ